MSSFFGKTLKISSTGQLLERIQKRFVEINGLVSKAQKDIDRRLLSRPNLSDRADRISDGDLKLWIMMASSRNKVARSFSSG